MQINVCIFGVSGYTGAQLIHFLAKHKFVNITGIFGYETIGQKIRNLFPSLKNLPDLTISNYSDFNFDNVDLIFSCLPHGKFQSSIINDIKGKNSIIDLSGDFRLDDLSLYEEFYGIKHESKDKNGKFVYGLSEVYKKEIKKAKFIANPGCYPTSILLPLIPLIKKNIITNQHIIIDSKSGVSGAGKKLEIKNLFSEINENFYSYGLKKHKHFIEIDQEISKLGKNTFTFIPSLVPVTRGLQSTIYIEKNESVMFYKNAIKDFYKNEPFIQILDKKCPSFSDVKYTNNLLLNIFEDYQKKKIIIISCIDNLVKGAAGQAIQNMNLMYDFDEKESLI